MLIDYDSVLVKFSYIDVKCWQYFPNYPFSHQLQNDKMKGSQDSLNVCVGIKEQITALLEN